MIFNSLFAALTAARAADRMAEITPLRPALMPAFNPAMAFTPAERSVPLLRALFTELRTLAAMALPVPLML